MRHCNKGSIYSPGSCHPYLFLKIWDATICMAAFSDLVKLSFHAHENVHICDLVRPLSYSLTNRTGARQISNPLEELTTPWDSTVTHLDMMDGLFMSHPSSCLLKRHLTLHLAVRGLNTVSPGQLGGLHEIACGPKTTPASPAAGSRIPLLVPAFKTPC